LTKKTEEGGKVARVAQTAGLAQRHGPKEKMRGEPMSYMGEAQRKRARQR